MIIAATAQQPTATCPHYLETLALGLQKEVSAIRAAVLLAYSNGATEGHVNRLKLIKRTMYNHGFVKEGLAATVFKDSNTYPTGLKVSDAELDTLNISHVSFHGEWNYTIKPHEK